MIVSKISNINVANNRIPNKVGNKNLSKPSFKSHEWPGWPNVEDAGYALAKYGRRDLKECSCEELKDCMNKLFNVAMGYTFAPGNMNSRSWSLYSEAKKILAEKEALRKALKL